MDRHDWRETVEENNREPREFIGWCDYWGRHCPKSGECDCIVVADSQESPLPRGRMVGLGHPESPPEVLDVSWPADSDGDDSRDDEVLL
ncbi:MAG TPA: hypothetical protein VJA26_18530 [Gammaproteobacteria bacterium]|nr:hypothetical protein [Gammaproteobacteria bacterium]